MWKTIASVLSLSWIAACAAGGAPDGRVLATAQQPVIAGDPTCAELGYGTYGKRIEQAQIATGTYRLDAPLGPNTVALTLDATGRFFDFASTLSLDAVIVRGGDRAHAYRFEYEAHAASGLSAPVDWDAGVPFAMQSIELCYDYELSVSKCPKPGLRERCEWDIHKSSTHRELTLAKGQVFALPYAVTVAMTGTTQLASVLGDLTVANTTPLPATIASITDRYGDLEVALRCGVAFPYVLAPGATLTCTYDQPLPAPTNGVNRVVVETTGLVGGGSASEPVDFSGPFVIRGEPIDCSVTVSDDRAGYLGAALSTSAPRTFNYTLDVGPYETCGERRFPNTASFVTSDTGTTGSSSWSVLVTVPCEEGCTLTPGYWKTHSSYGPAPYDDAWARLPRGADTLFFRSGHSFYEVLWTSPRGNAYYILAHQFIAAVLNRLNGASAGVVAGALLEAGVLFALYTPAQVAAMKGSHPVRARFIALAGRLDAYNNGLIGPGHCSE